MSNYMAGHSAEVRAAEYLERHGYKIRQLNWKTRYCEIDIVAEKDKRIHFVEVKYRRNSRQGYGLDYILPKKLHQMQFAAEMWVADHSWRGEYQLAALAIDAEEISFVEQITL
jgi:Holliday junction resolvase-like predicted endonuclease